MKRENLERAIAINDCLHECDNYLDFIEQGTVTLGVYISEECEGIKDINFIEEFDTDESLSITIEKAIVDAIKVRKQELLNELETL